VFARLKFQTEGEDEKDYIFCATFGGRGVDGEI